ncbi:MAG TPA: GntR family transcriptional regulator [Ktedonosporobacter sp.]|nr:GntR family transcriptional regulator [Ktedonosporobacter sp.]
MEKPTQPNYQRIKDALLQDIADGSYGPDQLFITQQEVCRRFQVSRITAERALNELVRDGVLVRRRGQGTFVAEPAVTYVPEGGISPFQDKLAVIGCIVSVTRSDHKTAIIRGVESICRETECHMLFFDSSESPEIEASNLRRAVKAGVAGIIIYPVDGTSNSEIFATIIQEGTPIVMVDRYYPTIPTDVVVPDNVAAGYEITKSLIEQGHRAIGTLWQEVNCTSVQERLVGYKQALREAHMPIDSEMAALRSYSALREAERRSLLASWLASPNAPSAILAANSYILGMVCIDLLHLGVQIGKDVVLAAMDKDDTGVPMTLGTASVILPSYQMGSEAMHILLNRLHNRHAPTRHVVLPVTLSSPASMAISAHVISAE